MNKMFRGDYYLVLQQYRSCDTRKYDRVALSLARPRRGFRSEFSCEAQSLDRISSFPERIRTARVSGTIKYE